MGWKVRRFNEDGIAAFRSWLSDMRNGHETKWPGYLISDPKLTEPLSPEVNLPIKHNEMTKEALATHIIDCFKPAFPDITTTFGDRGLWAALSCICGNQLWKEGTKPKADEKYIPGRDFNSFYRHNLMNICWIMSSHGDSGRALLVGKTYQFTEFQEQVAAAPIMNQASIWELIDRLYLKPNGSVVSGARGKDPNSVRGLKKFIRRLSCTWDVRSMNVDELTNLLDARFDGLLD